MQKLFNCLRINKIIIPDISKNSHIQIIIANPIEKLLPGVEYLFNAVIKDKHGENFTGEIKYSLREEVSGIEIDNTGKLTISNDITEDLTIEILLAYKDVQSSIIILIAGATPTPSEVILEMIDILNGYIDSVYR